MFGLLPQLGSGFGTVESGNTGGEIPTDVIESLTAFGKAKVNLKNLLSESTVFQDAIGLTGTDEYKIESAKARIHLSAYNGSGVYARPFAVISRKESDSIKPAGQGSWIFGGDLELRFERDIESGYADNPDSAEISFENFYESVMGECMAMGQIPGYFVINSYSVIEGPTQYEESPGTWIYGIRLNVNWGLDGSY